MTIDHYGASGERWAAGATLVYGPIAAQLVARSPHPLAGRTVLDAGAGTGVASVALSAAGALPVAVDFSFDMLAWAKARRPPAAVADVRMLPLATGSVDDVVAAFVLNHLVDPDSGFAELVRVTRPGGAVLAAVYSDRSQSDARDRVDEEARNAGWQVPAWYLEFKAAAMPLLASAGKMEAVARAAGLVDIHVGERAVDVGVTTPVQLVEYRLGQAHFAEWLDAIGEARAQEFRRRAADAVGRLPAPYRPIVVFLDARVDG